MYLKSKISITLSTNISSLWCEILLLVKRKPSISGLKSLTIDANIFEILTTDNTGQQLTIDIIAHIEWLIDFQITNETSLTDKQVVQTVKKFFPPVPFYHSNRINIFVIQLFTKNAICFKIKIRIKSSSNTEIDKPSINFFN